MTEWLETTAKPRLRPRTFIGYKQHIEAHVVPALGHLRLHALAPQQVQAMLAGLHLKKLAPRTIQGVGAVLRAALGDAIRWGLVPRNAAALARAPRVTRTQLQVFSPDQAKSFLAGIKGNRLEALFSTALGSGLRLGELLGLRWQDVDLNAGRAAVHQALQRIGKEVRFVEPKSERSRRNVQLPKFTLDALKAHRDAQRLEQLEAGSRWVETGLVFTSTLGTAADERNVRRSFKALLAEIQLPNMRLHDLRHSMATLLLAQGVPARVVMDRMSHSQVSLTLDTYSHVMPSMQVEAAQSMDDAIGCQPDEDDSAEWQNLKNSLEKVVSRDGIEPFQRLSVTY